LGARLGDGKNRWQESGEGKGVLQG
jgi:hypothetical protein